MTNVAYLKAVESTLGMISVRGEDDLDRMLGCIRAVRTVRKELEQNESGGDDAVQQRNPEDTANTV